jgi:hypothetical protein
MSPELISFLIHWLPTLIFLGCLGIAILFGAWRGMRKSAILAIQAGIVFVILLIVYFSIAGASSTDTGLFNLVSSIIGEGQIQSMMGVSKSCPSFKECFIELIPKLMPENEGLALIIADNGAYLATLAEMAVRIVVALALGIIYILAIFILYLVYLIFYPQRRYERNLEKTYYQDIKNKELHDERKAKKEANKKKKVEEAAKAEAIKEAEHELELHETEADESLMAIIDDEENSADLPLDENSEAIDGDKLEEEIEHEEKIEETQVEEEVKEEVEEKEEKKEPHKPFEYKKRRLWRALIGGVRNLISGIIFLSFVGGFFYILGGGPGDDVTPVEMSFGDPTYDLAYGAYSNIVTYGSTGIFKVLNAFKGSDNTPLYLFAADLVYQGGLYDEAQGLNENVYLRKEISTYTKFARDTLNLLLTYGPDEIRYTVLHANDGNTNIMDTIIEVMQKPGFQTDFTALIDNFNESTYFLNLSYSLISSFVTHIDKLGLEESLGKENLSLIKVLIQKGYLADEIPYEKYVKEANLENKLASYYISPDLVVSKDNAKAAVNMLFGFLKSQNLNKEDSVKLVLDTMVNVMPYITDFTFFQDEHSSNVSMVLARLYQFVQNTYFKQAAENQLTALRSSVTLVENPYEMEKYKNVNWVNEIKGLVNSLEDIIVLYDHAYTKDASVLDNIFNIFNKERVTYNEDVQLYENVKENVGNSFLLGDVLGSEYGTKFIENGLKTMLPDLSLPEINFSNVMKTDGTVKEYGEFYYLLCALESFGDNQENLSLISDLQNGFNGSRNEILDLVDRLCDSLLKKDSKNSSVIDNVLNSTLLTSIFSEFIISTESNTTFSIYVDDSIRVVKDGTTTRIITKDELYLFFEKASDLIGILKDIDENAEVSVLLKKILCEEALNSLDSKIIEGTMSKFLKDNITGDFVILPKELLDESGFISKDGNESEIKHIISLFRLEHFDISKLTKEYANSSDQMNAIVDMLKDLTEDDFSELFESKILYYSISNYLDQNKTGFLGDSDLIIPQKTILSLPNEVRISEAIKKEYLIDFLLKACNILPKDMSNIDTGKLVNSIVDENTICSNLILSATITNMMVNVDSIKDSIDGVIIIPTSYKDAGTPSDLNTYTESNIWYSEQQRLMKGIGALIDNVVDTDGNRVSITDPNLSDYIYDSYKNLNQEYEGETRLQVAYKSEIMQATISSRIDDMEFLSLEKKSSLKINNIYLEDELESLVDLVNLFDLDLKNTSVLNSAMSTDTALKLLDPYEINGTPQSYTNLHHQYEHKICGLILTEGIEDASNIPADAYESGQLYVTELEAESIISCLSPSKFNLDLTNFTFDGNDISINTLKKCMYATHEYDNFILDSDGNPTIISKILLQNFSEQALTYDHLEIPAIDYEDTYSRIKANSAYFLLSSIESLDPTFKLSSTIDTVTIPDPEDDQLMEPIRKSTIFRASIVKNIKIQISSITKDPVLKKDSQYVTIESKYDGSKNIAILTADETVNTFKAIKALNSSGLLSNVELSVTTVASFTPQTRQDIYSSNLISARLSEAILEAPSVLDYTARTTAAGTYSAPIIVNGINIQTLVENPAYPLLTPEQMENYFATF